MIKHLTAEEFEAVRSRVHAGKASIRIPRGVARQFFTHVSNRSIIDITDLSALREKILVWLGIGGALFALAACVLLVVQWYGLWAVVAVPLIGIFWAILAGLTHEEGHWQTISIALLASMAAALFFSSPYAIVLFLFVLSLWIHRITYILAQHFLERLVLDSFDAWDMLVEHIDLEDPAQPD